MLRLVTLETQETIVTCRNFAYEQKVTLETPFHSYLATTEFLPIKGLVFNRESPLPSPPSRKRVFNKILLYGA